MPIIFTFMLARFPAGLVIYWSWNNLLSIAQQWLIMRRTQAGREPQMARAHLTDEERGSRDSRRGGCCSRAECRFFYAAQRLDQLPPPGRPEVAFAGRSNVGKSSLINALTGRRALARASEHAGADAAAQLLRSRRPADPGRHAGLRLCAAPARTIKAGLAGPDVRLPARPADAAAGGAAAGCADRAEGVGPRGDGAARPGGGDLPARADQGGRREAGGAGAQAGRGARRWRAQHPAAYPDVLATSSETGRGWRQLRAAIAGLVG